MQNVYPMYNVLYNIAAVKYDVMNAIVVNITVGINPNVEIPHVIVSAIFYKIKYWW